MPDIPAPLTQEELDQVRQRLRGERDLLVHTVLRDTGFYDRVNWFIEQCGDDGKAWRNMLAMSRCDICDALWDDTQLVKLIGSCSAGMVRVLLCPDCAEDRVVRVTIAVPEDVQTKKPDPE